MGICNEGEHGESLGQMCASSWKGAVLSRQSGGMGSNAAQVFRVSKLERRCEYTHTSTLVAKDLLAEDCAVQECEEMS